MVRIIFIGGFGRSGSTVLDRLLGQIDGYVSVGELRHIWRRGFLENQLCGCRLPFRQCPFWTAVTGSAFGDFDQVDAPRLDGLRQQIDHMSFGLRFGSPKLQGERFREALRDYSEHIGRVCESIMKTTGARVIVDSSKEPAHGYALTRITGAEVHAIHLLRDSRAVAYSWLRQKERPEVHWKSKLMFTLPANRSSLAWIRRNIRVERLKSTTSTYSIVRYEDLMKQPRQVLAAITRQAEGRIPSMPFLGREVAYMRVNHTVSGNPMRFRQGRIELRSDEQWRKEMDARDRRMVTALTWPLLRRYG